MSIPRHPYELEGHKCVVCGVYYCIPPDTFRWQQTCGDECQKSQSVKDATKRFNWGERHWQRAADKYLNITPDTT